MKNYIAVIVSSLALAAPASASLLDLNILGGVKQLSSTDWGNRDSQGAVGIEAAVSPPLIPFSIVGGYLHSQDSSDAKTEEVWVGPGLKLDLPLIHFLVSGGVAFMHAKQGVTSTIGAPVRTDSDDGWGYYVSGAAFVKLLGHLNLGVEVRHSAAKVNLGGRDVKAGGMSYLGLVGLSF